MFLTFRLFSIMASPDTHTYGTIRFTVPDLSLPAKDRGLFALPSNKEIVEEKVELHDARIDSTLAQGAAGLDTQGFTYVKHQSALTSEEWFTEDNVESVVRQRPQSGDDVVVGITLRFSCCAAIKDACSGPLWSATL